MQLVNCHRNSKKFLRSKGLGSDILSDIRFVYGAGGNAAAAKAHSKGFRAITIKSRVYVRADSRAWRDIAYPTGSATFFEEVIHAIQWRETGTLDFAASYARDALFSQLFLGDAHATPIESQAIGMSNQLFDEYKQYSSENCK